MFASALSTLTVRRVNKTRHGLLVMFKRARVKEDVQECKRGAV